MRRLVLAAVLAGCSSPAARPPSAGPLTAAPPTAEPQTAKPQAAEPPPATPRDPARAAALLEEGRTAVRSSGEDGADLAITKYTAALAADPQCAAALWELGWAHQVKADYDAALAAWDKLKALDPNYPELATSYPILLMRKDQAQILKNLPDPGALPPPEEEPRPGPSLTLRAVGDIQMGKAWPPDQIELPPDDARPLFDNVKTLLAEAPLTFGNVETVLADEGESQKCGKSSKTCYAFRAPTRFAATLAEVGFDFVSSANNHSGDFGPEGRLITLEALDAAGLHHSGPIGDVASFQYNGLRIALVAFATGADMPRVQDIDTAVKLVADVDRTHDLVFVSFHAGAEGQKATHVLKQKELFYGEDRGDVFAFAHAVVDAGADLVLGSGPHVLRAMEIYKGRLVAYSMGNFCAWHGFNLSGPLGITAILEATLAPNGVVTHAKIIPLVIDQPGVPRPDPGAQAVKVVRELSQQDLGTTFFSEDGTYTRGATAASR